MSVTTDKPTATAIRPFHVEIPEAELTDLRRRIAETRWPEAETVPDQSQGVQLSRLQGSLITGVPSMTGAPPRPG